MASSASMVVRQQVTATNKSEFHKHARALRVAVDSFEDGIKVWGGKSPGELVDIRRKIADCVAICSNLGTCASTSTTADLYSFAGVFNELNERALGFLAKINEELMKRATATSPHKRLTRATREAKDLIAITLKGVISCSPVVSDGIAFSSDNTPALYVLAKHVTITGTINDAPFPRYYVWVVAVGSTGVAIASSLSPDAYADGTLEWVQCSVSGVPDAVERLCKADGILKEQTNDRLRALRNPGNVALAAKSAWRGQVKR